MPTLQEILKDIPEHQKQYLLRRIAGLDVKTSRELVGITTNTYNMWFRRGGFSSLHKQLQALSHEHRNEAIQILRRGNQLEAVLLEKQMLNTMKEELQTKEYNFIRTNMAREVYSKLIADLDVSPQLKVLSWQQRVQQILLPERSNDEEFETVSSLKAKHSPSYLITEGQQASEPTSEEAQG